MSSKKISGGYARVAQVMLISFFMPFISFLAYTILTKNLTLEGVLFLFIFCALIALIIRHGFSYADIYVSDDSLIIKKIFITKSRYIKEIKEIDKALIPFTYYIRFDDNFKVSFFSETTDIFKQLVGSDTDRGLEITKTKLSDQKYLLVNSYVDWMSPMMIENKKTKLVLIGISWLQIIGGITGLFLIGRLLLQSEVIRGPIILIILIGISLFVFSIYAGGKLFKGNQKTGIILSFINQFLQLFQLSLFGYGLSYSSGAQVSIGLEGLKLVADFSVFVSKFEMYIKSNNEFYFKINIIAVILIFILYKILKRTRFTEKSNLI